MAARGSGGGAGRLLILVRVAQDVGFVPGLLMAAAPLGRRRHGPASPQTETPHPRGGRPGGRSLPLVWLFQFTGGAGPQWAGRYILVSGLLLTVVGVTRSRRVPLWAARSLLHLGTGDSVVGVVWLCGRSHEVGEAAGTSSAFPEDVVVSTQAFWLRELGAVYEGEHAVVERSRAARRGRGRRTWFGGLACRVATRAVWLRSPRRSPVARVATCASRQVESADETVLDDALEVLRDQDVDSVALVEAGVASTPATEVPGFEVTGERSYAWLDVRWTVTVYTRTG